MRIRSVCWDITSRCNENCLFCYSEKNIQEASFEKNKRIMKNLISNGVGKISFVGGEPLLYKELFNLVEYGKSLDSTVQFSLTTNAILLADFNEEGDYIINYPLVKRIEKYFDWITFSLDAPTQLFQTKMGRNIHHVDRVLSLLAYISMDIPKLRIKINTVVSRVNINSLYDMIPILEQYRVNRWKLFQFLPSRGLALMNKDVFYIDNDNFLLCVMRLKSLSHLNISTSTMLDFTKTYITISPDGMLVVFDGDKYHCEIDMSTGDVNSVFSYINQKLHAERRAGYLN